MLFYLLIRVEMNKHVYGRVIELLFLNKRLRDNFVDYGKLVNIVLLSQNHVFNLSYLHLYKKILFFYFF